MLRSSRFLFTLKCWVTRLRRLFDFRPLTSCTYRRYLERTALIFPESPHPAFAGYASCMLTANDEYVAAQQCGSCNAFLLRWLVQDASRLRLSWHLHCGSILRLRGEHLLRGVSKHRSHLVPRKLRNRCVELPHHLVVVLAGKSDTVFGRGQ